MIKSKCVRCGEEFLQNSNPFAHFFSICQECHKKEPETIFDQERNWLLMQRGLSNYEK